MKPAYHPEIEGLRAIAVAGVLLCHFKAPGFSGGFAGVDVFFVISGYLITGMILRDIKSRSFSFRSFYVRRTRRGIEMQDVGQQRRCQAHRIDRSVASRVLQRRRIFPALTVTLSASLLAATIFSRTIS
jgi:peptidoglycan/LPS O-acetylase OafA/YrhL